MTITFLAPDGVPVTAQQERQAKAAQHGGGAARPLGGRSGFRVDTASNTLASTSTTWTLKPCSAQIDPGFATHQGMYGWSTDANITGTVTAADSTYTRIDIVYIQINDSSAGDGSGAVSAAPLYLAGTPSATPTTTAAVLPPRSFLVGTITVPKVGAGSPTVQLNPARYAAAGAPVPVSSQAERDALTAYVGLTVARGDLGGILETWDGSAWTRGIQSAGFTGSTAPTSGASWGPGPLTVDSANSRFAGSIVSPSNDRVALPDVGLYIFRVRVVMSVPATGTTWFAITNDTNTVTYASFDIQPGNATGEREFTHLALAAKNLRVVFFSTTATGYTLTSTVAAHRIG